MSYCACRSHNLYHITPNPLHSYPTVDSQLVDFRTMYPFGAGFTIPELSSRIRGPPPKPVQPPTTSNTRSRSVSASEHDLISYIFPDFNAVKYFQKEFELLNEFYLAEETECSGFEIYLVDQWIRSRKIGTVVSAFHGSYESKVKVIKFTIIKKPSKQYPPRFQEYLNEVILNHATFKKRDLASEFGVEEADIPPEATPEFLLVTNVSALPSNLNLIPIPGGDTRQVESTFLINSNLRKLNCGGRSVSLIADKVSDASEDKFRQMYRIFNSAVPIKFAIKELVDLIQTCLFYFDLLDARYCDGLLCMKTEDAINSWWNLIGLPHFNTKPNPKAGILPSRTVAAIISLTLSVKMRLQIFGGCDVPKDPFDFENFMISIGQFQKQTKIEKKRKLDLLTLLRLFYFTNQKFNSDNTRNNFGNDLSIADVDRYLYDASLNSSTISGKNLSAHTASSNSGNTSAYRRNKLHYSKELKKLTNVVKSTVQDHIITREDNDYFYSDPLENMLGNLRSKIALKLTENVTPADVETLDLDLLVRKYLVGMRLTRLWHGLSSYSGQVASSSKEDTKSGTSLRHSQHRHGIHHHHNNHSRRQSLHDIHDQSDKSSGISQHFELKIEDPNYQFVSLRDKISMNQEFSNQPSGRLGRMRYAFQGKRQNSFQKLEILSDITNNQKTETPQELGSPLFDNDLQRATKDTSNALDVVPDDGATFERKKSIKNTCIRRGSFPFLVSGREANISTLARLRDENYEDSIEKGISIKKMQKCASFSCLEEYFRGPSELYSLEKARIDYSNVSSKLLLLEFTRRSVRRYEEKNFDKTYRHINMELVKLHNMKTHMDTRKAVIDKEYSAVLAGRMKDLKDNIDRMSFRSRDLLKRINELEGNAKKFQFRLNQECKLKVDDIVDGLIHSSKFRNVFKDEDERQKLIFQLNGRDYRAETNSADEDAFRVLRAVIVFLYEMMAFVLQVFNFDRSNMNLERIRRQWGKLDPNRRFINKAYHFIGRDLVNMPRSSSSNSPNHEDDIDRT